MYHDLSTLSFPLPEDVTRAKLHGDFHTARQLIHSWLGREIPQALRSRLEMELDLILVMEKDEFPYTYEDALRLMRSSVKDFRDEELRELWRTGAVDWIYIEGEVHFYRRFLSNLMKTRPAYAERSLKPLTPGSAALLNENIRIMKENGGRSARLHLKASLKVEPNALQEGRKLRVHLPIPQETAQQVSELRIVSSQPENGLPAPGSAKQRTIFWEAESRRDQEFSVEYTYVNRLPYVEPDPAKASPEQPCFDTEEQLPHIRFTPYLSSLLQEIVGGETNPVTKAWKIYEYITTKVMYSFMRPYFTVENISEYAAVNLKGDCGVQAILFITLCRMAGIPARWQSGLYAEPGDTGMHDWAQFYIAPWGWMYADPSFGGSAYRAGDLERWKYYFGNLDIYRMPANSELQSAFVPPKQYLRADPVDNQCGEAEYPDRGLFSWEIDCNHELLSLEELPFEK